MISGLSRRFFFFLAAGSGLCGRTGVAAAAPGTQSNQAKTGAMIHQLRIYEIFERNKAAFHARFRDHAAPLMARYGFHILSMWEAQTNGRAEFVYLLQWPDEAAMIDRWQRFLADQEWMRIKQETAAQHGDLVGEIQSRILRLTPYSPQLPS